MDNSNIIDKNIRIIPKIRCCSNPRYYKLSNQRESPLWGCASCGDYRISEPPDEWKE